MNSAEVLGREVRLLREMLADATRFLDSIESRIGNTAFLDMMPNNCHGRGQFRAALDMTKTQPTAADTGTARALIAHMERPQICVHCGEPIHMAIGNRLVHADGYSMCSTLGKASCGDVASLGPDTLTCEDYDPDAPMGEDYETGESMPLSLITTEQGEHVRTLTLNPADVAALEDSVEAAQ